MKFLVAATAFATVVLAADICETSGYDKGSPSAYASADNAGTPALCSKACKADSSCKSFVVGEGICNLYTAAVANNLNADDTGIAGATRSPYYFYDVGCTISSTSPPLPLDTTKTICNVQGYDKGNPAGTYSEGQSPEQCGAYCKAKAGCTGFAMYHNIFTHRTTNCYLYTSLKDNVVASVNTNGNNEFYFYEMACLASSSSTSAAPVASSTLQTVTRASTPAASTPTPSSGSSLVCGTAGYDKGSPSAYSGVSGATLDSCKASCKADSTCKGYVFGGGDCLLYTSAFANNLNAVTSSPYKFYDAGCGGSSSSATTSTAASTPSTAAAVCKFAGYESSSANANILGFQYKPSAGCKSFCQGKSAVSYEQYYDYCICFSKPVGSVATADAKSTVVFNDISC